jgi:hypothetical protein
MRACWLVLFATTMATGAGCGGDDMGGGSCSPACDGQKVGCKPLGSSLSALSAITAGEGLASHILTGAPVWMGGIEGLKITRDGLPSPDPDVSTIGGQQISLYTSGWVFGFCAGMDSVQFGAGPQTSSVSEACQAVNCSAVMTPPRPQVDSAAAIAAAFPSDPAGTLYNVSFLLPLTNNQRVWSVTQRPSGPTVKVDADTGAIQP